MSNSIFNKIKKKDFYELISRCKNFNGENKEDLFNEYEIHVKNHLNKNPVRSKVQMLQEQWYKSILEKPDYKIYNHPYYLCDIWLCWIHYSRKGLLAIKSPKSLVNRSIVNYIGTIKNILDLGCGFGYTTAALKEMFPLADVIGTNLKESYQYNIAESVGAQYGFKIHESFDSLPNTNIDLIFASEYFEHIINPIEHLYCLLKKTRPTYLIIANGFNGKAIGHFNSYMHMNKNYSSKDMNLMFNKSLKILGYEKIKTKVWNNRPSFWVKK